ncbi:MAG: 23S rRNA (guanosine(2251)-2'-O)-methyltransferase RlmB, partial [Rhodospirillales bacterium]
QGIAILAGTLPEVSLEDLVRKDGTIVILDQASDPRNIGAVLRSAAAFGACGVIVQDRHAPPVTGTLCKAASGAADLIPMVRTVNLSRALNILKEAGYWCVGLDGKAKETLAEADLTGKVALVLGSEGGGLRRLTRDQCDLFVRVPIINRVESLNVSTAAAIALYELKREGG